MTGLLAVLRGMRHRAGSSLSILLVALVAVAAVTIGPTYYAAAQASILRDGIRQAPTVGQGLELTQSGPLGGFITQIAQQDQSQLVKGLGSQAAERRLFAPPIEATETEIQVADESVLLAWRSGFCAHLHFASGSCPAMPGHVAVSTSLAFLNHWKAGQQIHPVGYPALTISGVYTITIPQAQATYWFAGATRYFSYETAAGPASKATPYDAMFTPLGTLTRQPTQPQGNNVVDFLLRPAALTARDVPTLSAAIAYLQRSPGLADAGAVTTSSIPATMSGIQASWQTVEVPVVLITAQLLILAWLLLFLIVADAAEARGGEVALAKLRGRGRWRTLSFGLAEPVLLLAAALPGGVLAGWALTTMLSRILLRPGTPVGLPALAWAGAAVASAGGAVAVLAAARRTLSMPVVQQWQRTSRVATQRGWVLDAILVTATLAGLVELKASGEIGSAHRGVLGLLVPGLLGIAVAVLASRALVLGCRAGFGFTRRRGMIGAFLALRHIARRPGGMRTTIVLATAFALAGFAVGIWSVAVHNIKTVASAQIGAAAVLSVTPPASGNLVSIVDKIDPAGHSAMAVDEYTNASGSEAGDVLYAVDPQRYARIAAWQPEWAGRPIAVLAAALDPPAPNPVMLTGSNVRIQFRASKVRPAGSTLTLDVYEDGAGQTGQTPLDFGAVTGTRSVAQQLTGCPCMIANLTVSSPPQVLAEPEPVTGTLTITGIAQQTASGSWQNVSAGLGSAGHWLVGTSGPGGVSSVRPGAAGLTWTFHTSPGVDPLVNSVNRPYPLPALAAAPIAPGTRFQITGLDGNALAVRAVTLAAAIPGAPSNGIVVDRTYAERAAGGGTGLGDEQVWVAPGALDRVRAGLRRAGVQIDGTQLAGTTQAMLIRQGPALATVLFLADAAAAAVLAAGAAVSGLYLSGRRRRYEYAALLASRVSRRQIRLSLLAEQATVLGFGVIIGLAAGLGATLLAVRSIPEFTSPPSAPPLTFLPSAQDLVLLLGAAVVALAIASAVASAALVRSVRPDLLREAEP